MQDEPTQQARRKPKAKNAAEGIEIRHSRFCPSRDGGKCTKGRVQGCRPGYEAGVFDARNGKKIRKTFAELKDAKQWRADATSELGRGKRIAPSKLTLRQFADGWLADAQASPPSIKSRSGEPYKPSVLREYERNLRLYVLKEFGAVRLTALQRGDVQKFVKRLEGEGKSASKIHNVVMPLRVLYRHALELDEANLNPTVGLRLPAASARRERAATAAEAADLIEALRIEDQALWATAFYAGLRRGELRGLRWQDVDLGKGVIRVSRSWDDKEGEIAPKSLKGTRTVPIIALLRDHLTALKARTGREGQQFVLGLVADRPFTPNYMSARAAKSWETANKARAKKEQEPLVPIALHEARHTFVTLMFEAGVSLERIGDYVGHSSTWMTDRYRHLLEGHEAEAARLMDDYLARADTRGRIEQLDSEGVSG